MFVKIKRQRASSVREIESGGKEKESVSMKQRVVWLRNLDELCSAV